MTLIGTFFFKKISISPGYNTLLPVSGQDLFAPLATGEPLHKEFKRRVARSLNAELRGV
jgi:hypothetical protein